MSRHWLVAAAGALALGVGACGGAHDDVPTVDARTTDAARGRSPSGGWAGSADILFACFDAPSSRVALGTTREQVATDPCCWYGHDGSGEGSLTFQDGRGGSWRMTDDDHLYLSADPPCGDSCGPVEYRRDARVTCAR